MTVNVAPETVTFAALPENLRPARSALRRYMAEAGWGGRDLDIVIAVGEVLQNIIRHGFAGGRARGRITMTLEIRQDALLVDIDDTAPPSLPSSWSAKGREAHEGGLGLNMIHSIASDVSFTPTADGNHASLTFNPD
ncbi:MAG: ATP-binding protein [Pseudomonadota bacterium]|nr:ATP-binding protein [Pseudomonadota bacterium]MEC8145650.1 ATP-binding protein [Pseudomonadota bacterium]